MLIKTLTIVITCGLILALGVSSLVLAHPKVDKQQQFAEKVKTGILSLGTGPDARIEVKLHDKTKLSGFVSAANEETFVVCDSKSGGARTVAYDDVAKVKGNNLSTGKTLALVGIIMAAGLVIVYLVVRRR